MWFIACFLCYIAGPWEWANSRRHFNLKTSIKSIHASLCMRIAVRLASGFDAAVAKLIERGCEMLGAALHARLS